MTETLQDVVNAISLGSLYALFGCGLALVLGTARIANFAYGATITIGAYAVFVLADLPWPLIVLGVVLAVVVLSLSIDGLAFRPLRETDPTALLVASFAVSVLLTNLVIVIAGARTKGVDFGSSLLGSIEVGGVDVPKLDLLTIAIAAAALLALTVFLRRTLLGVQLRAAAEDFTMARLLGVNANRVIAAAFAVSGAIAGVAALLLTVRSGTLSPDLGVQPVLIAFIAVVVGGMGSLAGATAGGFLIGCLSVALEALLPPDLRPYRDAFLFSLIIVILLGRPQGIFGSQQAGARI
jgi:branched-chain amino acid transport system permease protein